MDAFDEVKCWNRHKRQLKYEQEHISLTTTSPKNTSSGLSYVSAITCDESIQHLCSNQGPNLQSQPFDSGKIHSPSLSTFRQMLPVSSPDKDDIETNQMKVELTTDRKPHNSNNGSLISRITTGYLGILNEDKSKSPNDKLLNTETTKTKIESMNLQCDMKCSDLTQLNFMKMKTKNEKASDTKHFYGCIESEIISFDSKEDIMTSADRNKSSYSDQWREVLDHSTGKNYFYNRRTRESSWQLPPNAILLKKKRVINEKENASDSYCTKEVSMLTEAISEDIVRDDIINVIDDRNSCYNQHEAVHNSCNSEILRHISPARSETAVNDIGNKSSGELLSEGIYCMFCGIKCVNETILFEHFTELCPYLESYDRKDEICVLLYKILNTYYNCPVEDKDEFSKEKGTNQNHIQLKDLTKNSDDSMLSPSDDDEMIMDSSLNHSFRNNSHEVTQLLSTCPFCSKRFHGGSHLSRHLLNCNERKSSTKKRVVDKEKQNSSKIQSLLTDGGRHLPGYPKLETTVI